MDGIRPTDIMKPAQITLHPEDTIQFAAGKLYGLTHTAAPVLGDDGSVRGILQEETLMNALIKGLSTQTVIAEIIEQHSPLLHEDEHPEQKIAWKPAQLPVVSENNQLLGMFSPGDWLRAKERAHLDTWALLQAMADHCKQALLITDENAVIKVINDKASASFQLPVTGAGMSVYDLAEDDLKRVLTEEETNAYVTINSTTYRFTQEKTNCGKNGKQAVFHFFYSDPSEALNEEQQHWKQRAETMESMMELTHDGVVMVDASGRITMLSQEYADFLELNAEDVIGQHVKDVIPSTRMHIVAETGKPEIADIQPIKGDYMVASRMPIYRDGKLEGAVGKVLFKNLGGFKALKSRIEGMEKELDSYRGEFLESNRANYRFEELIGSSKSWQEVVNLGKKASANDSNVLLLGESGTGKELFAHAIHNESARAPGPFIKVNCAAIPGDLIESELFGYVEGSFTGAKKGGKKGKFEAANGGTIFLDEIGELPLHMQVKLLRVLQEREVEKVGSTSAKKVNIRVIAATNRDLERMIDDGEFRLDLYYRMNVFSLVIPPLRKRPEDLQTLVPYFLQKVSKRYRKQVTAADEQAMGKLLAYSWPGNTRELENVIERAVNLAEYGETRIQERHLPEKLTGERALEPPEPLTDVLEQAEKEAIKSALRAASGNKSKAAKMLAISRTALYEKLTKYALQ
ncbi:sigma-54-dependent Fis family transcriptional regulator [Salisediminibacterium halotolerans]|uniref:PAS domain S-box-containing protein n=1 Tax=Salisediminibacterium halotolerans TaxID=517425 RepID=A0A1H9REV7_9BACI|nr:PAS domain S-box-containing protein [Salisediminibacterium haloalkalitolerans]